MSEHQKIRADIRPVLEELNNILFSDKHFTDDKLQPVKEELFNDLYDVYNKYVKIYDSCGFRAFSDELRYTDVIDSI